MSKKDIPGMLSKICIEINTYKGMSRDEMYTLFVNNKLKKTVLKYNSNLDLNSNYLLQRSSVKVLKALTKIQKKSDKKSLEDSINNKDENKSVN